MGGFEYIVYLITAQNLTKKEIAIWCGNLFFVSVPVSHSSADYIHRVIIGLFTIE